MSNQPLHTHATRDDWAWCTQHGCVPPAPAQMLPNLGGMYDMEQGMRTRRASGTRHHGLRTGW